MEILLHRIENGGHHPRLKSKKTSCESPKKVVRFGLFVCLDSGENTRKINIYFSINLPQIAGYIFGLELIYTYKKRRAISQKREEEI